MDYCAPRCEAMNGGTILKKDATIRVWFWIRTSLPKRAWKKCMEFKERSSAGKLETWHVSDEGGIAKKVYCTACLKKRYLAKQINFYIRRKSCYLALLWYPF
jgi:hypothetical protein